MKTKSNNNSINSGDLLISSKDLYLVLRVTEPSKKSIFVRAIGAYNTNSDTRIWRRVRKIKKDSHYGTKQRSHYVLFMKIRNHMMCVNVSRNNDDKGSSNCLEFKAALKGCCSTFITTKGALEVLLHERYIVEYLDVKKNEIIKDDLKRIKENIKNKKIKVIKMNK